MEFSADMVMAWLGQYLWALARIAGLLMSMVTISGRSVPTRIRMALAFMITFAIVPVLPSVEGIELFSVQSFVEVILQTLVGIAMGFISQMVMQTFVVAGQIIAMQTSLGFASMVDPTNGQNTPVIGQFYMLLATMIFLVIDGHLQLISLVAMSFETLPIGESLTTADFHTIAAWYSQLFFAALAMSMSSVVAMLLVNFSFGVMTRAAPQLNIFSIGFAVSMLFGLLILWLTIGGFTTHFENQWNVGRSTVCTLIKTSC
jgi:flagellar biosynthetic protein FliR